MNRTASAGFQSPYEYKPFFGSSHTWAIGEIDRALSEGALQTSSAALDIGCSRGFIGAQLRERGLTALDAIEIDSAARVHAAPLYRRIEASIEPFLAERYQLVLLLDVLEHLADPFSFMGQIAPLVSPGGILLISVPNIAHWSVRFPLLFGRFEYRQRGLLDRTHLQFFTRRRVRELVAAEPSLKLSRIDASIEPVELVLPRPIWDNAAFRMLSSLRVGVARTLPGLCAFQHLVVATKRKDLG